MLEAFLVLSLHFQMGLRPKEAAEGVVLKFHHYPDVCSV